jgi:hypothetical protein
MQMATKDEAFPSRFLKAADLKGKACVLQIIEAEFEELTDLQGKKAKKMVLHFKGTSKQLPLNVTNWNSVVDITGEADSENWIDFKIKVYPDRTSLGGEMKDCIRITNPDTPDKPVKVKANKPKPNGGDGDVAIPDDVLAKMEAEVMSAPQSEDPGTDMEENIPF